MWYLKIRHLLKALYGCLLKKHTKLKCATLKLVIAAASKSAEGMCCQASIHTLQTHAVSE